MANRLMSASDPQRSATVLIALIVSLCALHFAQDIAAPMTLAVVVGVIVAPLMDLFNRLRIPVGYSATIILIMTLAALGLLILALEPLLWRVMDEIPRIRHELQSLIYDLRGMIRGLDDMNSEVQRALGGEATENSSTEGAASALPSVSDALFLAPVIIGQVLVFAGTYYFFLLTRLEVYSALAKRIGGVAQSSIIQQRFKTAETLVSRYFVTISFINFGLGLALTGVLMLLGLPLPWVWGMAAFLLNYVLYVGPALIMAGLLLSGLVHFDGLMVGAPFLGYLSLNMMEAQFVTPSLVGKHVSLNALLVFVALVFGLWFWGPIGGIVSIPVMVIAAALLDDSVVRRTVGNNGN
ncbi:AI-2E family transporter [Puniceibacterium sediminis]|uniref:Predicted PurR-regulated permease PerM n=1 Tax=Puniceibacterium sediminis TaxID=1608407 RepID=A0A238UTS8_9RHOB|nr:AI-2E family transporter [Puniceibacterium sediminis]SNR25585.1 Predicted PurR-regulated permease PerM [Puniceibacterium sediminis]